jgi:hypothetical protein
MTLGLFCGGQGARVTPRPAECSQTRETARDRRALKTARRLL